MGGGTLPTTIALKNTLCFLSSNILSMSGSMLQVHWGFALSCFSVWQQPAHFINYDYNQSFSSHVAKSPPLNCTSAPLVPAHVELSHL